MTFPESPHLVLGSGKQIGIVTLWTKKEHVLNHVPDKLYAVGSQLYSRDEGVSNLLRSLLAHKEIRDLVITGADLNGCAQAVIALWSNGVENGQVVGAPGYVDPEIPSEAVDRVRAHVELHDQRETPYKELAAYISAIPAKASWGAPEEFPQAQLQAPEEFPYPKQHCLRHKKLVEAGKELAYRQRRLGVLYNVQLQVIGSSSKPDWLSEESLPSYQELSSGSLARVVIDSCSLTELLCCVYKLQADGKVLTCSVGELVPDSLTQDLAAYVPNRRVTGDPAGNILIRLVPGEIQVTHLGPDGKRLEEFSSTSGEELYRKLVEEFRVADMSHAGYVGYELGKAEFALKNGEWYEQDIPLFFKDADKK